MDVHDVAGLGIEMGHWAHGTVPARRPGRLDLTRRGAWL
jgi:hypothetical protein